MTLTKKYLAGVSGGPDSMALLNMYRRHIRGVCHVNYAKRLSAVRDEKIVEKFCLRYKIPFFCLRVDAAFDQMDHEKNFQTSARKIRYDFYLKCAQQTHCQKLLLGHNLDDSLETAYDQLERDVTTLFYGIKKKNNYRGLIILRPLIHQRKKALSDYCIKNKIEFGIDETNFSDAYQRNKIRKLIASWTAEQFQTFYNKVKFKNIQLQKTQKIFQQSYKKWKKANYSQNFFLTLANNLRFLVLYQFLSDHQILCRSRHKLTLIADFINKGVQPKMLRIHRQKCLQIQHGCLCVVRS